MSNEDTTKYDEIANKYDIDDFELWWSWKLRDNKIEKWQYDKDGSGNSGSGNNNYNTNYLDEKTFFEKYKNGKNK